MWLFCLPGPSDPLLTLLIPLKMSEPRWSYYAARCSGVGLRISIYSSCSLVRNTTAGEQEGKRALLLPTLVFSFLLHYKVKTKEATILRAKVIGSSAKHRGVSTSLQSASPDAGALCSLNDADGLLQLRRVRAFNFTRLLRNFFTGACLFILPFLRLNAESNDAQQRPARAKMSGWGGGGWVG